MHLSSSELCGEKAEFFLHIIGFLKIMCPCYSEQFLVGIKRHSQFICALIIK